MIGRSMRVPMITEPKPQVAAVLRFLCEDRLRTGTNREDFRTTLPAVVAELEAAR